MIDPEDSPELPGRPGPLVVWVDGALMPGHEARISPFDHGLLTGDGVFETLRVYRGEPYCWRRHYERLARSAQGMGLAIPPGPALRRAALEVIGANRFTDGRLPHPWRDPGPLHPAPSGAPAIVEGRLFETAKGRKSENAKVRRKDFNTEFAMACGHR